MSVVRRTDNDFNLTDTELLVLHEWWLGNHQAREGVDSSLMLRLDQERSRRTRRPGGMDAESIAYAQRHHDKRLLRKLAGPADRPMEEDT